MNHSLIDYVNHYRGIGWVPIPVHDVRNGQCSCRASSICKSPGKHPRVTQAEAKAADDQIWQEWANRWPDMNLAVLTGSSYGIFVVDIDPRHQGDINFLAFCEQHGLPPPTLEAASGGGGSHLFFRYPTDGRVKSGANVIGDGIDIRGDGGIIIVEPSVTKGAYKWL
jgi:hypothetical protein